MAYVPVPKDLTKVKTKVAFNLTKRQLVCFTGGALISGSWSASRAVRSSVYRCSFCSGGLWEIA